MSSSLQRRLRARFAADSHVSLASLTSGHIATGEISADACNQCQIVGIHVAATEDTPKIDAPPELESGFFVLFLVFILSHFLRFTQFLQFLLFPLAPLVSAVPQVPLVAAVPLVPIPEVPGVAEVAQDVPASSYYIQVN